MPAALIIASTAVRISDDNSDHDRITSPSGESSKMPPLCPYLCPELTKRLCSLVVVLGSSPSRGTTFFLRRVGFLICLWLGEVSSLNVRPES